MAFCNSEEFLLQKWVNLFATLSLLIMQQTNMSFKKFKDNIVPVYMKMLNNDTLHLKLLTFRSKNIKAMILNNMDYINKFDKIIIDVRDNCGGFVNEATELASLMIYNDIELDYKVVKRVNNKYLSERHIIKGTQLECFRNKKLFVLCNENTMSSAEYIFLRSLKLSNIKTKIIGTQTAGLSGQAKLYSLIDNCELQITNTRYFDFNDKELTTGVCPDIKVQSNIIDILNNIDTQLMYCMNL